LIVADKQQDVDLSSTAAAVAKESRGSSAVSSCTGSSASSTNLQRRASAGSFHQSLSKKKAGKKAAPMSHIPGIRPSKHHAKRFNGVLSKYGVHPANAEQLAEVSLCYFAAATYCFWLRFLSVYQH